MIIHRTGGGNVSAVWPYFSGAVGRARARRAGAGRQDACRVRAVFGEASRFLRDGAPLPAPKGAPVHGA